MQLKKYTLLIVLIILFIVSLLLLFQLTYQEVQKQQLIEIQKQEAQQKIEAQLLAIEQRKQVEKQAEQKRLEDLKIRGINPDKMTIRYINVTDEWKDDYWPIYFSIKKVYLTPDIADAGHWRDNYSVPTKNAFLVVEVAATNSSTASGGRTLIDAGRYLRLVINDDSNKMAPISTGSLYLSPQEDGKEFVIFAVDKNIKEINLLSGNLAKPKITHLNFFESDVKTFNGVFLLKTGLAESYSQ